MSVKRDPDAILAAWLEDGPTRLPDTTRRSIAVTTRNTRQARRPTWLSWRFSTMNGMSRLALGAVAVVAVVIGGLFVLRPGTQTGGVGGPGSPVPSASPVPSVSLAPSAAASPWSIPAMTQPFTSAKFGYSIRYPAGWVAQDDDGPTSDGSVTFGGEGYGMFRALSVAVPDGVVVDDWIAETLTPSPDAGCSPPRETLDPLTIDGHPGSILGFCGVPPAPQIEATVVVDKRAYLFTFFDTREVPKEAQARAMFDALVATITLDPQAAGGSPSPSPS